MGKKNIIVLVDCSVGPFFYDTDKKLAGNCPSLVDNIEDSLFYEATGAEMHSLGSLDVLPVCLCRPEERITYD